MRGMRRHQRREDQRFHRLFRPSPCRPDFRALSKLITYQQSANMLYGGSDTLQPGDVVSTEAQLAQNDGV
jgi:hypothetical protein